ncbi:MAG: 30S ribosomal protein S8e [Candidatus Nezhaarchaeota archaeon]|nr:30S ribosomal protein S8e [Candidatus Nezhaarchaeota archaeon]
MSAWQGRDFRRLTGGKVRPHRGKRKYEVGSYPTETVVGESESRVRVRVRGGGLKTRLKVASFVNVSNPSTGRTERLRILQVVSNPASVDYSRRGVLTKGAIVKTEAGLVKITSRPGQDGVVNGILTEPQP